MHPEIARQLADQRRADLLRSAHDSCRAGWSWRGSARRWLRRAEGRRHSGGASCPLRPAGLPGVFLARPEALGFRAYLTDAEAEQLIREWAGLLGRFADRADDRNRRPAGAVPFEVVLLGRRVPDLAGTGRGLSGPAA
ncbi:MAG: hypothetical protein LBI49_24860 [Nocardiopsaceae bacterium]|jgi:hypothetical protein|nr:hypothetical protein [Nocardiopsaceae bacterium]